MSHKKLMSSSHPVSVNDIGKDSRQSIDRSTNPLESLYSMCLSLNGKVDALKTLHDDLARRHEELAKKHEDLLSLLRMTSDRPY